MTQLNIDADANCAALSDRLDTVESDVTAASTQAHTDAGTSAADVSAVDGDVRQVDTDVQAVNSTLQGQGGTTRTVEFGPNSSAQLDGLGHSEHIDLMMVLGVLVGVFVFDVVLRKVWP